LIFLETLAKCIHKQTKNPQKIDSALMNCPTLEKTPVPLSLCQIDTKEKPTLPKGRRRKERGYNDYEDQGCKESILASWTYVLSKEPLRKEFEFDG
jgi:hypothetical protein